jgi:molecular chaperone HscB
MAYILKQHQLLADEEKYDLPSSFLMEMMDLNDTLDELTPGDASALNRATAAIQEALHQWLLFVDPLTLRYDTGDHSPELLKQIKDFYFRKKYLLRIKERIDKFAAR